jgi:hypothetical protein
MLRVSRHRDHPDRRIVITQIVITGIAVVITGITIVITRIAIVVTKRITLGTAEAGASELSEL